MTSAARHPRLRRRLVVALLLPTVALIALGAVSDYLLARHLTDDAYDQAIAGVAEGLAVTLERDSDHDLHVHFQSMMRTLKRIDAPDQWRYLVIDPAGHVVDGDPALGSAAEPAGGANPSFRTLTLGPAPERVATLRYGPASAYATIVVAETVVRRRAATGAIVGAALAPNLALLALATGLVLAGVRIAMRPLDRLGERINAQNAEDVTPLPLDDTPQETLALLQAWNRLIERLRAASRSQQVFLNHAAHQLRTPLAAMQAHLELLRDAPAAEVPARCGVLQSDAARLSHLTAQMLTLGRTDREAAGAFETTELDLEASIAALAPSLDDRARARGVQLAFELAPTRVEGVDWMLREALSNLADNAIAHAPTGTVVTLRCAPASAAHPAFVEVEDHGEGIPPESRERVFEPFVRLSEQRRPGTGLGLTIVRSIAERHRAVVDLRSGADGTGTVVRIRFV